MEPLGNADSRETSPDDTPSHDQRRRLKEARQLNDERLKGRFEQIFAKYDQDFSDIGDEIDLRSGAIVVNNGHLEQMQHEVDSGLGASAKFVRTFQEKLEHESDGVSSGQSITSEDDIISSDEDELALQSSPNVRVLGSGGSSEKPTSNFQDLDKDQTTKALFVDPAHASHLHSSPPARVTDRPIGPIPTDNEFSAETSDSSNVQPDSCLSANVNMLGQLPDIRDSLAKLTTRAYGTDDMRTTVDDATIQKLGTDIANKVASLISGVRDRSSKRKWQRGSEPLWDYPEIPISSSRPTKRIRHLNPPLPMDHSSPNGKRSLWAPARHSSRPRLVAEAAPIQTQIQQSTDVRSRSSKAPAVLPLPGPSRSPDHVTCQHCGLHDSSGVIHLLHGQIICSPCFTIQQQMDEAQQPRPPGHQTEPTEDHLHNSHLDPETPEAEPLYTANTSRHLKLRRKDAYSVEEDAMIIKLRESDNLSWVEVANQTSSRTPLALQTRYNSKLRGRSSDARRLAVAQGHAIEAQVEKRSDRDQVRGEDAWWDQEKDRSLLHLRDVCHLHWHEMVPLFPYHSEADIERRYNDIQSKEIQGRDFERALATPQSRQVLEGEEHLSENVIAHRFTPMEDAQIIRFRQVNNLSWGDIAKAFPARDSLALRRRYARILGPETKNKGKVIMRNSTPSVRENTQRIDPQLASLSNPKMAHSRRNGEHENDTVMRPKANERLDWDQNAAQLPGRAASSIKNRFEYLIFGASAEQYTGSTAMDVMPQVISSRLEAADRPKTPARQERPSRDVRMQSKSPSPTPSVPPQSVPPETRSHQRTTNATAAKMDDLPYLPGPGHTTSRTRRLFTKSEDNLIREMREEGQGFDKIAIRLPGRSLNSVWGRYNRVLNPDCEKKKYHRCSTSAINSTPDKSRSGVSASKKRKSCQSLAREEDSNHQASDTIKSLTVQAQQPPPIVSHSDVLHNAIDSTPGVFEAHNPPAASRRDASADWLYPYNKHFTQSTTQQPITMSKPVHESRRLEAPLLRKAIDNTMRRQSDFMAPTNAALSFPRTIFHGSPGQPIWLYEDSTSNPPLGDGGLLPATRPLSQNGLDLPYIPDLQRDDQVLRAPGRLFSLEKYRQLAAVVNNFALQHGKPHWMAKVKQIYEQDPSDSRLESLLDIATTDFIFPSQRLRVFEDTLASNIEQRHQFELSHTPVRTIDESRMSEMESLNRWQHTHSGNSTLASRPAGDTHERLISGFPEGSTGSTVAVPPAQSLLQITMPHNLFKNKITNDFNSSWYGEQAADEAKNVYTASQTPVSKRSKAPRDGTAVTKSVQSLQAGTSVGNSKKTLGRTKRQTDTDDVGHKIPVAVSFKVPASARNKPAEAPPTRGRAAGVSTTSPKKKASVQSSAQVESATADRNLNSCLEESAKAPQAKGKSTKRKRAPPRATAASTSEDEQVATSHAKLPIPPRARTRAQCRSQPGVSSRNTRSNASTDHRPSVDGRLTVENSEDDEEVLLEEDAADLRPLKKQLVMPVEATTSPSKTTASSTAAQPLQDTNSSPSCRRKSSTKTQTHTHTAQIFRQAAQGKATATPAVSTDPSKTLPTPATSVQTPSKSSRRRAALPAPAAAATSGFKESARVAMRRQSRIPSARPSTPTKIINHRVTAETPLPARSDACKRVVQTPIRDLRADDSEDELA